MHNKRTAVSKYWPTTRKGTKYLIRPSHRNSEGIPLLILMREVLGFVRSKRELKKILLEKKVLVNNREVTEENYALSLLDTLGLKDMKKYYRLTLNEKGKLMLEEISEQETTKKISRVIGKTILKGKKTQINLNDGRNLLTTKKINVGDSVVIDFKNKKIEKVMPVKEKSEVLIISGKHRGKKGKISEVKEHIVTIPAGDHDLKIGMEEIMVLK